MLQCRFGSVLLNNMQPVNSHSLFELTSNIHCFESLVWQYRIFTYQSLKVCFLLLLTGQALKTIYTRSISKCSSFQQNLNLHPTSGKHRFLRSRTSHIPGARSLFLLSVLKYPLKTLETRGVTFVLKNNLTNLAAIRNNCSILYQLSIIRYLKRFDQSAIYSRKQWILTAR